MPCGGLKDPSVRGAPFRLSSSSVASSFREATALALSSPQRETCYGSARRQVSELLVYLACQVDADHEVGSFDVRYSSGTAQDGRHLEAQDLSIGGHNAETLGTLRESREQVLVLSLGRVEVYCQRIPVGPSPAERAFNQVQEPDAVSALQEDISERRGERRP